jgi:hypothetical protein
MAGADPPPSGPPAKVPDRDQPRLFGELPAGLFRLLAGSARWFYAELLEFLDADLFSTVATVVTQRETVATIADYIDRKGCDVPLEEEEDTGGVALLATSPEQRAQVHYRRLVDTGWLIEHRDRYRRLVDLDGNARLLLQLLIDIRQGRTRSYGGEVLQVLGMLEQAASNPDERSEAIRNAARSARSFMHHLRSLSGSMRRLEQEIGQQTRIDRLFQRFFDDFVAQHLIEDYKRLHTRSNPFRFRVQIVEQAHAMLDDGPLLDSLAAAYQREGRAPSVEAGHSIVADELRQVIRVFDALDEHIELIEETNRRVERRIRNTVRHMDRIMDADTEAVAAAMRALGAVAATGVPANQAPLLAAIVPLDSGHLFQNPRRRTPPDRVPIRRAEPDPAFLAFQAKLREYRARMTVNSTRMRDYLNDAMADLPAIDGTALPLRSLEDFAVFEQLRLLPWLEGGAMRQEFAVDLLPGRIENEWIACPAFRIRRLDLDAANA